MPEMTFDPILNRILNPENLDQAAITTASQSMCDTSGYGLSRQVEIDLSGQQLDSSPERREILEIPGPPTAQDTVADSLTYQYRLQGQQDDPVRARFTVME